MLRRNEHIRRLSSWPTRVEAQVYNMALRAMARASAGAGAGASSGASAGAGGEVVLDLRGMKGARMRISAQAWTLFETEGATEKPLAAWQEFAPEAERGLHEPVTCELHLYHDSARILTRKALRRLEEALSKALAKGEPGGDDGDGVVAFRARKAP